MLIHYKYRWLYAFFIGFLMGMIGFFYDIKPHLAQLSNLQKAKQSLNQKLTQRHSLAETNHSQNTFSVSKRSETDALADLFMLIHQSGLIPHIIKIKPFVSNYQDQIMLLELTLQGNFLKFLTFLAALNRQSDFTLMLNFSLQSSAEKQSMVVEILIIQQSAKGVTEMKKYNVLQSPLNPFCSVTDADAVIQQDEVVNKSIALTELKMVGYIQQGDHNQVLLLTPNNKIISVKRGSILGKEQGMVIALTRNHIIILLPSKKTFTLSL